MGGSITLTTQASARYMPSMRKPVNHQGAASASKRLCSPPYTHSSSSVASMLDGTLAPAMVSHSTIASMATISGKPKTRLVTMWSSARSKSKRSSPGLDTTPSAICAACTYALST